MALLPSQLSCRLTFDSGHQAGYRDLARYAALPLVLTPELVHYLRNTFLGTKLPWVAEVDLLLSDLCRVEGYEQYAMDVDVRAVLLTEMEQLHGATRMQQVARLLLQYVSLLERANTGAARQVLEAQRWAALVYLDQERAAQQLEQAFQDVEPALAGLSASPGAKLAGEAELARLASLTEKLAPALAKHPHLLEFARDVTSLLQDPPSHWASAIEWPKPGAEDEEFPITFPRVLASPPVRSPLPPPAQLPSLALPFTEKIGNVVFRMAWSPDGRYLACPTVAGEIVLLDFGCNPPAVRRQSISQHGVNQVAWSPDGQQVASASFDRTLRIWSVPGLHEVRAFKNHNSDVHCVSWSPDGRRIATGTKGGSLRIWQAPAFQNPNLHGTQNVLLYPHIPLVGHRIAINVAVWAPDQSALAVGCQSGHLIVLDGAGKKVSLSIQTEAAITSIAWSPRGELFTGHFNGTIRIWHPEQLAPRRILSGHAGWVSSLSFSADGRLLASKSSDNRVRLWNTGDWSVNATVPARASNFTLTGIAFHPYQPWLAMLMQERRSSC